MDENQRKFAKWLTEQTKTRDEWLSAIRFGLETLLTDQAFLFQLIADEVAVEIAREHMTNDLDTQVQLLGEILVQLGITLGVP